MVRIGFEIPPGLVGEVDQALAHLKREGADVQVASTGQRLTGAEGPFLLELGREWLVEYGTEKALDFVIGYMVAKLSSKARGKPITVTVLDEDDE